MRAGYIRIGKSSMGDPEGTNLEGYSWFSLRPSFSREPELESKHVMTD